MNERIEKSLYDILQMIDEVDSYFEGGPRRFDDFMANTQLRRAVERNIEIIGEATKRILQIEADYPIAAGRKIVNTRNLVAHAYDSLLPDMMWNIVINHLPPLRAEVERLLAG